MRFLFSFLLAISVLSSSASFAANKDTFYYTLDNGLRIIVRTDHRAPVVVSQIWYQVGSSYEQDGVTGISHMLEHLMFKGTKQYPEGQFNKIIVDNGGDINAFTDSDATVYYEELEARRLPLSFALEADRMRNAIFTEEQLVMERNVVAEERRLRTEDVFLMRMYERFNVVANAPSPYRYPVVGWMSDIENFSYKDVRDWYDTWYAPNNAILVVVGDVDPDNVYKLAKHHFAHIPANPNVPVKVLPAIKYPSPVPPVGKRRIEVTQNAVLPYVLVGYNVPVVHTAMETWEPYALQILSVILNGGPSARLNTEIMRNLNLANDIKVFYEPFSRLETLFLIMAATNLQYSNSDLENALLQQIANLKTTLVPEQELARVKNQIVTNEIFLRDSLTEQALKIGKLASIGLSPELEEQYLDNIKAVTSEQLQLVAQRYFTDERLTIGILNPSITQTTQEIL